MNKTSPQFRIGNGYDINLLKKGRDLIIGGVKLEHPNNLGLDGHSDADVLSHSIMDALLGALSLGDIGKYFPPSDDKWKNADSLKLLSKVVELLMADVNRYFQTKIILPNINGVPHEWSRFNRWTLAQFDFCKQCNERKSITLNSSGDQVRNWVKLKFITHQIYKLAQTTEDEKNHHIVGKNLSIIELSNNCKKMGIDF